MGSDDHGVGRLDAESGIFGPDDVGLAPTVIHADIAWRGTAARARAPVRPAAKIPAEAPLESVIVGSSARAARMRELIELYADYDAPVLVTGETGAGKELVARELHRRSARRGKPFVALNAGAVPETLAAAELFGHAKGAFTGAVGEREGAFVAADGGILFLDEIGEMPLSIQAQLLRVLEDGLVAKIGSRASVRTDFRLIAATNVDLGAAVERGAFRSDLFYRINVLTIAAPPLRERGDDVVEIAENFIVSHADERLRGAKLTPAAADVIRAYPFPGNVRELRNVLQRALVHAGGKKILPEHLMINTAANAAATPVSAKEIKDVASKFAVFKALRASNGDVSAVVKATGLAKSTIYNMTQGLDAAGVAAECERLKTQLLAAIEN
jgi:DNA-binding NtrC family response regulator